MSDEIEQDNNLPTTDDNHLSYISDKKPSWFNNFLKRFKTQPRLPSGNATTTRSSILSLMSIASLRAVITRFGDTFTSGIRNILKSDHDNTGTYLEPEIVRPSTPEHCVSKAFGDKTPPNQNIIFPGDISVTTGNINTSGVLPDLKAVNLQIDSTVEHTQPHSHPKDSSKQPPSTSEQVR